ncbi:hypothetical protein [Coraliomargarita akajimensis]|uniref:DUF4149 domain-containing protein n=1 Tax=Coraliomargarita akajimensis (strain DSM 45221 / IAM 15411 / JCM 23193 / KCTC 12865 / 04OKA010-24) TaxID=583355 RepID=D5EQV9_CORAD|nr:hypothetical protein [Coraliomargarita akajimensis]ADE53952.1 hypothetical protein Caka_0930 [Coraliomargarita akajimensis DSM 45221]
MEELEAALILLRWIVDGGLCLLLWWVQLWAYPKIARMEPEPLAEWHPRYVRMMTVVAGSMMVLQLMTVSAQVLFQASLPVFLSMALVAICWLVTFTLSVPCHRSIAEGASTPAVRQRLVRTNWLRTLAWTGVFLMNFC